MNSEEEAFKAALAENLEKVGQSDAFAQLYSPSMADFKDDPWPVICIRDLKKGND